MNTTQFLISMTLFAFVVTVIASGVAIFVFYKNRAYLEKLIKYQDGMADIQATIKAAILEHHEIALGVIDETKQEILTHITFTNRWQKVIAKLIKIKGSAPLELATGSETREEAAELHEIGLDIAKVAFDDKQDMEEESELTKTD